MNIFVTSECPIEAAYNLCHVHVVKMVTESCQIMSSIHRILNGDVSADSYNLFKATHKGNPTIKWAMASSSNYQWLLTHCEALGEVYYKTRGKVHGSIERCLAGLTEAPRGIPEGDLTPFAKVVGDDNPYSNIVDAYRHCITEKYKEWPLRVRPIKVEYPLNNKPDWLRL